MSVSDINLADDDDDAAAVEVLNVFFLKRTIPHSNAIESK